MSRFIQQPETRHRERESQRAPVLCLAVLPRQGFGGKNGRFPLYWLKLEGAGHDLVADFEESELGEAVKEILSDPLLEKISIARAKDRTKWAASFAREGFQWLAERQFQPGVTDNLARTVEEALSLKEIDNVRVASGEGFLFPRGLFASKAQIEQYALYTLYHPLTDRFAVHELGSADQAFLQFPAVQLPSAPPPDIVPLNIDDAGLLRLSQNRLLALNLEEMKAIRSYYQSEQVRAFRETRQLPPWPTDVELEIIAQTWSEHCKHKIFNARITHTDEATGASETIDSLYRTYVKAPTFELKQKRSDLLSVFEDNSGVVRWNNEWAVCFKVETHNSPSALEPYGGALTGILGVNRDVLGTGLGARPIFNTDVFCFAYPSADLPQRPKLLPAVSIMSGVRRGVEDGGNKSGIPTVNGAIYFHPGYRAKPLVFCGTGGILPTTVHRKTGFQKYTQIGDTIVMVGGRIGKDGIHGATFSSEALHEGSPVSAVQIGDPFTQKRVLDFIIEARDRGLITGITDNGAGGLSSSVGEMALLTNGATLELDNIPLKYPGLADYEIVISESQERMTLSTKSFPEIRRLAQRYNVEATAIGTFHSKGYFEVTRSGKAVALIDLNFLHAGPRLDLESSWSPPVLEDRLDEEPDVGAFLLSLLSHPNISSRESVIRQYDHEVQGLSVIKPLMGPLQIAPCDAAVFQPLYEEKAALVVSNGLCPQLSDLDPSLMAICAVDEAIRNAVCTGADPSTIVLLDNFCWPDPVPSDRNPDAKRKLGQLVLACRGLSKAVVSYRTPLISGKDSMKNDFDDGTIRLSIPPTLLVSAMGRMEDADLSISMEFKSVGDLIYLVSAGALGFAGSHYLAITGWSSSVLPSLDLAGAARMYELFHDMIKRCWVKSAHDVSEGGLAVTVAECAIGSGLGAHLFADAVLAASGKVPEALAPPPAALRGRIDFALFAEGPARIVATIQPELKDEWEAIWSDFPCTQIGVVSASPAVSLSSQDGTPIFSASLPEMTRAWKKPLPFD